MGGYFGGRLAAVGEDVWFLARGAHLAAMRAHGLRIDSPVDPLHLQPVQVTDDPAAVGPVDVVFFTVKLYDNASAVTMLGPLVGPRTVVVPFQNGVDSVEMLRRAVHPSAVAGGSAYVAAVVAEPGVIRHTAMKGLVFGPLAEGQRPVLERLHAACLRAGIDATLSDQVMVDIWTKFARLAVFAGMTAVTRCPIGPIVASPDLLAMLVAGLKETIAVARARGVALPDNLADDLVAAFKALPPQAKSSMLQDLERGRPLELPWLNGAVVRLGRDAGVETPVHRFITAVLEPHARGASALAAAIG